MATITPGTDATIQASKAESQLFHALMLLQEVEASTTFNPSRADAVQTSFNDNTLTFTARFDLPCEQSLVSGVSGFKGKNYLTAYTAFTAGSTAGTFKSTNLPAYVVELIYYCQMLENTTASNPSNKNYVNATFDSDKQSFTGTITLPYTRTIDAFGDLKISIPEYLQTAI
jgi:hypothetical protein